MIIYSISTQEELVLNYKRKKNHEKTSYAKIETFIWKDGELREWKRLVR